MKADTRTLQVVLHGDRRFVVPVYQRPYVWEQERQWEPLWTDVETTAVRLAERRLEAFDKGIPAAEADRSAPPHFLGAIVLEQHPTATGDVDVRSVVDGQQRLTTLQLLLRGTLDSLEEAGIEGPIVAKLRKLIRNDEDVVSGEALHKVWPRPAEQEAYLEAMAASAPEAHQSQFSAARAFFAESAMGFLTDPEIPDDPFAEGDSLRRRAALLVATLIGLVKLVIIDLEDVDDAQVIFEALNARNTPLSATDLVKNLLFMRAQSDGFDPQALYEKVWARFDDHGDWWRKPVGVGHAQRPRQDWLLGDWLIAQLGKVINVGRLYGEFRRWLDSSGTQPVEALETLSGYADAYEKLHGRIPGATVQELEAFDRIDLLNITAATPVLLWLLSQPEEELPSDERQLAFEAIESFVVRRMAAKAQTRAYGQAFAEVLKAAQETPRRAGRAVVDALRAGPHGYQWIADDDLAQQFKTSRYYGPGGVNQERLRLLLGAVDARLQKEKHKAEPVVIEYDKLQIEHVIPREWQKYWPVRAEDEHERTVLEQRRETHIHHIGNLTLVSDRLNPAMGNDPWTEKRAELGKHSNLRLNALLCDETHWDEDQIVARGGWLAQRVAEVWPGPGSSQWES